LYNYAPLSALEIVLTLKWPPVTRMLCELLNIVSFCRISFVMLKWWTRNEGSSCYPFLVIVRNVPNLPRIASTSSESSEPHLTWPASQGTILDYFAKGDSQQIRYTSTDWCTNSSHAARKAAQDTKPSTIARMNVTQVFYFHSLWN